MADESTDEGSSDGAERPDSDAGGASDAGEDREPVDGSSSDAGEDADAADDSDVDSGSDVGDDSDAADDLDAGEDADAGEDPYVDSDPGDDPDADGVSEADAAADGADAASEDDADADGVDDTDADDTDADGVDDTDADGGDADDGETPADGGGLSPAEPEARSAPGQDPAESVDDPAEADDDPAESGEDPSEADDAPAEMVEDPLAEPDVADEEEEEEAARGEADGGVITEDEAITPVEEPEETGDLWEDARPSEPPDDEEMPLTEHIEEMMRRLAVVVFIAGGVSLALFPLAEVPIEFLWNNVLPGGTETDPRVYGPLELMFTRLKVASLGGLVVALPAFVYETYQFMRPGLYPHERRYYLAAVPTSLVLALIGIGFAYFFVLPAIFIYFLHYTEGAALVAFSLKKTFDLILILMGYLAIVFQIPLFVMLAIMMGLTTRQWLADRRIYFWGGFLGISFLFGIDPTGMAPIIVAATMVVLFEGTLLLLKWTGRG